MAVITTIGLQAMPLIRYRTGDFTRLLPPCPCGGISRRIDRVSRREGDISMEALDSALFRIPGLVDYRVTQTSGLHLDARITGSVTEAAFVAAVQEIYPSCPVSVQLEHCRREHRPLYPGKRYLLAK